jgi:hypothetical protein|tara:strand:- start:5705 stop:6487 length:783 start_codon:yes stop_codon:yes gene_type:complete
MQGFLPTNKDITVWFSCGVASAVAAKYTLMRYGEHNRIRIVNNPVKEEHEDNQRFLKDVETWLGVKIEQAISKEFPEYSAEEVWKKYKYMAGIAGAPCTMRLKKHARQQWEQRNNSDHIVLGFTYEEKNRASRFKLTERDTLIPVLIDEKLTKQDCFDVIDKADIRPPKIYEHGFPNANCIGCVKATSTTYWNLVRQEFPEVFKRRADQSKEIGAKLVRYKGTRIQLHDLPETAKGHSIKTYRKKLQGELFDCGIFCEEK